MNLNNLNSNYIYALTGVYASDTSSSSVTSLSSVYAYNNTTYGVKGSSTGNISGVYDLNGCICEYVAGYITNGYTSSGGINYLSIYGSSLVATTSANANGYLTLSTKYATVYPYNSSSDNNANNWTMYNSKKTSTYGYGDAILEVSTAGNGSYGWNGDCSIFPYTSGPFFMRGGYYGNATNAGAFAFSYTNGPQFFTYGFRVVLVCE